MKTKNVIFAGLTALSMTLSPVATCVAQLVTPVYAAEATQTYATQTELLILVKVMLLLPLHQMQDNL